MTGRVLAAGGLMMALVAASRPATFAMPIAQDAGEYLYMGDVLLHGGTPYVDAADNKGPLTFVLFAVIRLIAGTDSMLVRLTLLVAAAATAIALAAYVAHFAGRRIGLLAGSTFAVLCSSTAVQGGEPNTEHYGTAAMVAAWWLATRGSRRSAAAAGALVAAAILVNIGFAAVAAVVLFELLRVRNDRPRRLLAAIAGGAGLAAPFALWLGAAGALDDFRTQVVEMARRAVGGYILPTLHPDRIRPPGVSLSYLTDVPARGLWEVALVGVALALADRGLRRVAVGVLLWIAVMYLRVKLSSYEYDHYHYPALPGLAASVALGAAALWRAFGSERRAARYVRAAGRPVAVAALAATAWTYALHAQWDALKVPANERWGRGSPYAAAVLVARFLRDNTSPGDPVFMAHADAEVYWLAKRRAPTRFFIEYELTSDPSYPGERRRDLVARPPVAIGKLPGDEIDRDFRGLLRRFSYRLAYDSGGARVWLRR